MLVMWNRGASVTLEPHGFGGIGIEGGGGGGGRGPGTSQFVQVASLFGRRAPQGSLKRTTNTVDALMAEHVDGKGPKASKPAQLDLLLHHAEAAAMLIFAVNMLPPAISPTRQSGVMISSSSSVLSAEPGAPVIPIGVDRPAAMSSAGREPVAARSSEPP